MSYVRQSSITRFEGSEQVMIVGLVENSSEGLPVSRDRLRLITSEGFEFRLVAGGDVDGIESLTSKQVSMLGILAGNEDNDDELKVLTVLGYRVLAKSDAGQSPASNKPFRWKAA